MNPAEQSLLRALFAAVAAIVGNGFGRALLVFEDFSNAHQKFLFFQSVLP